MLGRALPAAARRLGRGATRAASSLSPAAADTFTTHHPEALSSAATDTFTTHHPYDLSPDQREIAALAAALARNELAPHSAHWDAESYFPVDAIRTAASLGFAGLYVDPQLGGSGLSRLDGAAALAALARRDVPAAAYLSIQNMVAAAVDRHGSPEQRARFLPDLAGAARLASYRLAEPGAGSGAAALATSARRTRSGDYELTGKGVYQLRRRRRRAPRLGAHWRRGRGRDLRLRLLRRRGARLPPPGEKNGPARAADGGGAPRRRAQPTAAALLDGARSPAAARLGAAAPRLPRPRSTASAPSLARHRCRSVPASSLDYTAEHAGARARAVWPLRRQLSFRRARFASPSATRRSRARGSRRVRPRRRSRRARPARRCAAPSPRLVGGYGYPVDHPVERLVRDLRVHRILEGTNEITRPVMRRETPRARAARRGVSGACERGEVFYS
jgi:alkylation response protein AidB-like acyl-CoA dehydrogenase